jgi:phage terminase Nu1 subunit (DNA packaging protein)
MNGLKSEQAAELLGVSLATLNNWLKSDDPPPRNIVDGTYPLAELGDWIRQKQILKKGRGGGRPWLPDLSILSGDPRASKIDEETRLKRLQADKVELDLMERRGELVEASEVSSAWQSILSRVRSRLLKMPSSIAPIVAPLTDPHEIQKRIDDSVREALEELSDAG